MKRMIALPVLLVTGCVQFQPQVLVRPDGKQEYNAKCSSSAYSIGSCYEQAGNICGPGGGGLSDHP